MQKIRVIEASTNFSVTPTQYVRANYTHTQPNSFRYIRMYVCVIDMLCVRMYLYHLSIK